MTTFVAYEAEGISVRMSDPDHSPESACPEGWTPKKVDGLSDWWDLTPNDGPLTLAEAWDVAYRLRAVPGIAEAAPSVRVLRDVTEPTPTKAAMAAFGFGHEPPVRWAVDLVRVREAWAYSVKEKKTPQGDGVVVAHPDSGYLPHPELEGAYQLPGLDFVEPGQSGIDRNFSTHGLSTSSVIVARDDGPGSVTGVAPRAKVWPLRVTKEHFGLPAPVLLTSGARNLRDALLAVAAVPETDRPGVVSISLGWLDSGDLHAAVRACVDAGVIVVAASGNYLPFVVWPAAYPEVIACAGCTDKETPWWGAGSGPAVDVTGPAHRVWRASYDGDQPVSAPSSGTSYATAMVAGIAALWLAHHDLAVVRAKYGPRLAQVFADALRASCAGRPVRDGDGNVAKGFGAGIVDAAACLAVPLPQIRPAPLDLAGVPKRGSFDALVRVTGQDPGALRQSVGVALGVPADQVESAFAGHGEELTALLAGDPQLRRVLSGEAAKVPLAASGSGMIAKAFAAPGLPAPRPRASTSLTARLEALRTAQGAPPPKK